MSVYDYVTSHFEVIRERPPELHIICPWCKDFRGKFYFNTEKAVGRCWRASCDARASLAKLIAKVEGLPIHIAARRASWLKEKSGIRATEIVRQVTEQELPRGSLLLRDICASFDSLKPAEQQVVEAGVSYLVNKRCADFEQMCDQSVAIGTRGKWFGRILLPALEGERVASLQGRLIEVELAHGVWVRYPGTCGEKYLTPDADDGYVKKGEVVYGINHVGYDPKIVVVEDAFSALALQREGFCTISFWGTSATAQQLAKLNAYWRATNSRQLIILLDSDARNAAIKLAEKAGAVATSRIATITGLDPDEDIAAAKLAIETAAPFNVVSQIESLLLCQH